MVVVFFTMCDSTLADILKNMPSGYSEVKYNNARYALTVERFNSDKSVKIYARQLNTKDFISLNVYRTSTGYHLKPCEMPKEKVIDFLLHFQYAMP